jgi:hypothetical protein
MSDLAKAANTHFRVKGRAERHASKKDPKNSRLHEPERLKGASKA